MTNQALKKIKNELADLNKADNDLIELRPEEAEELSGGNLPIVDAACNPNKVCDHACSLDT